MSNDNIKDLFGAINVPLAILWSKPIEEYKEVSSQAAANTAVWSENLNTDERLWLVGKVDTTALYGERVVILGWQSEWVQVAVISQPTKQNSQGYPGWVLSDQVCYNPAYLDDQENCIEAVISKPQVTLYSDSILTQSMHELSFQTRLPVLSEKGNLLSVRLPDGKTGYLDGIGAKKTTDLCFSGQTIIKEAQWFLGLKYLWGGTSSAGFDCSGFMFRLYQSQGITIPRDASEQAGAGVPVAKDDLQPGDLLFFATDNRPDKIHHVGMYIGEGLMIHSPNSRSVIRIEAFEAGVYGEEYWGARRYALPK